MHLAGSGRPCSSIVPLSLCAWKVRHGFHSPFSHRVTTHHLCTPGTGTSKPRPLRINQHCTLHFLLPPPRRQSTTRPLDYSAPQIYRRSTPTTSWNWPRLLFLSPSLCATATERTKGFLLQSTRSRPREPTRNDVTLDPLQDHRHRHHPAASCLRNFRL